MASVSGAPGRPVRAPRDHSHWIQSGLLVVGFGIATAGLGSVLSDVLWWFIVMLVVTAVLLTAAIVRQVARRRGWAILAAFVAGVASVTLLFAPSTALLGVIPTPETLEAFRRLEQAGSLSIENQSIPAEAVTGILYLLCVGLGLLALAADALVNQAKSPALAGLPLLVVLLVPSAVRSELSNVVPFVGVAIVWLAMLTMKSRPRRLVLATATSGVVVAVLLPLVLPSLDIVDRTGSGSGPVVNPILTLGADLRRGNPSLALTYSTSTGAGQYLRLATLNTFTGRSWEPSRIDLAPGNEVDSIGPLTSASGGPAADVPRTEITTAVEVEGIVSRWLPVPWIPLSVTGLEGQWGWESDDLTIRSDTTSAGGQVYEVQSLQVAPTIEQLRAAGTTLAPGFADFLDLPDELPPIVAQTAQEVAGDAATNYDRAVALQNFFRSGEFQYSEDAPVEAGYDGSGAEVLGEFLEVRAGYCVHFSSAMAAMARSLGIPARVVVGFTPGGAVPGETLDEVRYRVSTDNLHAWPELHFDDVGWVRFEPTPGRGSVPVFAAAAEDDPSTPDVDESVAPDEVAAPDVPTTEDGQVIDEETTDAITETLPDVSTTNLTVWPFFVALGVALLVGPWALRLARRNSRLAAARDGSARAAWDELGAVVTDLGIPTPANLTPRQLADELGPWVDDTSRLALSRLRAALEAESFAASAGAVPLDDLRVVLRSLRRRAGVGSRIVATVLPRSLVSAWLPQLVSRPSSAL